MNNTTNVMSKSQVTMSSREIADLVGLRHDNVKRTIETLSSKGTIHNPQIEDCERINDLGLKQTYSVYVFSGAQGKRDSIIVIAQLCPEFTARIVDRWQELEQALITYPKPQKRNDDGLVEYRKAKALDMYTKAMDRVFNQLPSLSEVSKQAVYATTINPLVGHEVLPLPILEEKTHSATDIGKMFGVSANKIGRVAKELSIKTDEYTIIVLDKSRHSDKQVESIRYKDSAVPLFNSYFAALSSDTK